MGTTEGFRVDPWMIEGLASALRDVGCPSDTAARLARQARIEQLAGDGANEATLLLHGIGSGLSLPVEREEFGQAAWSVAQNVAADNAEAHDRGARGEAGWTPLWPLPDRRPRRV